MINEDFLKYANENRNWNLNRNGKAWLNRTLEHMHMLINPVLIDKESFGDLAKASEKMASLIASVPGKLFQNNPLKISKNYKLPLDRVEQFFSKYLDEKNLIARGDFILSTNGYKCIEFNIATNIGGIGHYDWLDIYADMPVMSEFLESYTNTKASIDTVKYLIETSYRTAREKFASDEINFAIISDKAAQNSLKELFLEKNDTQMQILFCCYSDLLKKEDGIYFDQKKIDIAFEYDGCLTSPELLETQEKEKIILYNGPRSIIYSHKFNLAYLSSLKDSDFFNEEERNLIEKYVPWTRILKDQLVEYENTEYRIIDLLLSKKDSFVLKHGNSYNGKDVIIGRTVDDKFWEKSITDLEKTGEWIAQEFSESVAVKLIGNDEKISDFHLLFQPFVFNNNYSGAYLRVSPSSKKGRITTDSGALNAVLLCYEEKKRKVSKKNNEGLGVPLFSSYSKSVLTGSALKKELAFWEKYKQADLSHTFVPSINLNQKIAKKSKEVFIINDEEYQKLKRICNDSDQLYYLFLLANLSVLVSFISGEKKLVLGSTIQKNSYNVNLINGLLPVFIEIDNNDSFKDLLSKLKQFLNQAYQNQSFPTQELFTHKKSFNFSLIIDTLHDEKYFNTVDSDVLITLSEKKELSFKYNTGKYDSRVIKSLFDSFSNLLEQVLRNPSSKIQELSIFSKSDKENIESKLKSSKNLVLNPLYKILPPYLPGILYQFTGELRFDYFSDKNELISKGKAGYFDHKLDIHVQDTVISQEIKHSELKKGSESKPSNNESVNLHRKYPVTAAQRRFWMIDQIQGESLEYLMTSKISVPGVADSKILKKAIAILIKEQEILKTYFKEEESELYQFVDDKLTVKIDEIFIAETDENKYKKILEMESKTGFDLSEAPLFRVKNINFNNKKSIILYTLHHIIADGQSLLIFEKELSRLYRALLNSEDINSNPGTAQYYDYARWQNKQLRNDKVDKTFWLEKLSGDLPVLNLPRNLVKNEIDSKKSHNYRFKINETLSKKLRHLAQEQQSSVYMLLLAVFNLLLSRLSGQTDILIGSPVAGRDEKAFENLIGCFINTIVLRNNVDSEKSFIEFLNSVRENTVLSLNHQRYPFEELINHLGIKRDISKYPVTSVYFNLLNFTEYDDAGFEEKQEDDIEYESSIVDLNCYIKETRKEIFFSCVYRKALFPENTVDLIFRKYLNLLEAVVLNPGKKIGEIQTKTRLSAKTQVFKDIAWYNDKETIVSVFEKQARENADKIAVQSKSNNYSYQNLNYEANQWANYLEKNKDKYIAICVSHSEKIPLAILSVLKAGKSYVPIDSAYPKDRISYILSITGAAIVLVDSETESIFQDSDGFASYEYLNLDEKELVSSLNKQNPDLRSMPADEAYILFTSGSTGKPKGVIQNHRAVLHFVSQYSSALKITNDDRISGLFSYSHDSSTSDIFASLLNGATYFPMPVKNLAPGEIKQIIKSENLSIYHSAPTVFRLLNEDGDENSFEKLRIVKMAGEEVRRSDFELFQKIFSDDARFIVSFGSTESTLNTMNILSKKSDMDKAIVPVGDVLARTEIKILDESLIEKDILEAGEIYLSGKFISKSYFKRDDLTKERFLDLDGKRFFKTGDFGRCLADGKFELLGREDQQVKIRGNRVELAEIENMILKSGKIKETAVALKQDKKTGDLILVAYFSEKESLDPADLRRFLADKLPDYMIPDIFMKLKKLPLTESGKVNHRLLPDASRDMHTDIYIDATTENEKMILELWKSVFALERISIESNFFQLGGHSLSAMQIISRINAKCNLTLTMKQLFENPTIKKLAACIDSFKGKTEERIPVLEVKDYYDISEGQRRLWVIDQIYGTKNQNKISLIFKISGNFNRLAFENAFRQIIKRHEPLRTSFHMMDEKLKQKVHSIDEIDFKISFHSQEPDSDLDSLINNITGKAIFLDQAPLLNIEIIQTIENDHIVLILLHHIISDGWSVNILFQELKYFYQSFIFEKKTSLPGLKFNYKDYIHWLDSRKLEKDKGFWLEKLQKTVLNLDLPYDYRENLEEEQLAETIVIRSDKETTKNLKRLAKEQHTSLANLILAAYTFFLSHSSNQKEICVAIAYSNREHKDIEKLIGFFINTLIIKSELSNDMEFMDLLTQIKENVLEAVEHSQYPYDRLIQDLRESSGNGRNNVNAAFVYQNTADIVIDDDYYLVESEAKTENLSIERYSPSGFKTLAKFNISLFASLNSENLDFKFEFNRQRFKKESMERMINIFSMIIENISKIELEEQN